jgi:acetyltransferase-like isoleucine patch superfamily enzyme
MRAAVIARRFLVPGIVVSAYYAVRSGAFISHRAEVEASPNLSLGRGVRIGSFVKIKATEGRVSIGDRTRVECGCLIAGHVHGIEIGPDCVIGPNVVIVGVNYRYDRLDLPMRNQGLVSAGPVTIGRGVTIGAGAVILDHSRIEEGVTIAPRSIVSGAVTKALERSAETAPSDQSLSV